MNQKLQQLLDSIQQSAHLSDDEKNTLAKTVKDVDKEMEITSFKLDRTEKVKRTTSILLEETIEELEQKRKAVEAQNRELEIESSLERVRTVALSMNRPDDMLHVCRVISEQLQHLNVQEIRNVQTAIFYETKGTYINYEFYAKHDKSLVTEVNYKDHDISKAFADQMTKGPNEIFIHGFNGKEVQDWYEFQKTTNVFIDTYLETANSLNYYWYSLGPVALGISTYKPLTEEQTNLFKRFLKVFELSYRRYLDIEKAEAQAYEAKVEASLEKVRAVAMSMNKPDDLLNICETLFKEFNAFGFVDLRNAMINIHNDENKTFVNYDYSDIIGKSTNHLAYDIHPVIKKQIKQIRRANDAFSETVFAGKDLTEWKKFRKKVGEKDDPRIKKARALYYYFYSIGTGSIGISTFSVVNKENLDLLKRYRNVFNLSYQRYTDLALAEAQAHEAKIEAALERIRSSAMAMHSSEELSETVNVFFKELKSLGVLPWRCGVGQVDGKTHITNLTTASVSKRGDAFEANGQLKQEGHPVLEGIYNNWKHQTEYYPVLKGKDIKAYYKVIKPQIAYPDYPLDAIQYGHFIYFKEGFVFAWTENKLSEQELDIFRRFTSVLSLTYRRYLDLKEAEAQAHEAKIEASLERMRAAAMSMRKSEELITVSEAMYKELTVLGFTNIRNAQVAIKNDTKQSYTVFEYSDYAIGKGEAGYKSSPIVEELYNELGEFKDALYQKEFSGKEFDDWRTWRKGLNTSIDGRIEQADSMCFYLYSFDRGHLGISTFNSITNEQVEILKRFKNVFELSYRRYIDVAQAEEQAREAQIELALERVRARTMAMQKSDELSETVYILFQQFRELGENPDQATIGIINEDEWVIEYWVTMYGNQMNRVFKFSIDEPNVTQRIYKAWKKNKKSLVIDLSGKELYDFATYRASMGGAAYNKAEKRRIINVAFFSKGLINVQSTESRSEESIRLLERFAAVFEQTYTRFLDLQKAEAQARESQIQLAMERVRARTMAMQKSDELGEAASLLFKQIADLGTKQWSSGFDIWNANEVSAVAWMSNPDGSMGKPFTVPYTEDAFFKQIYEAKLSGNDFFVMESAGKELEETYQYLFNLPEAKKHFDGIESLGFQMPTFQITHCAFFSHGYLMFITYEPAPEMWDVFKRFAKVFEQTYTRFLDLQKAEAQARESQIELGLERVRARAMAMQKSNELSELVDTVFKELTKLDFALTWCIINIIDESSLSNTVWAANPDINKPPESYHMLFEDYPFHHAMMKGWKEGKIKDVYILEGQEKKIYDEYLFNETEFRRVPAAAQAASRAMEKYVVTFSFSNFGGLQTVGDAPLSDANLDILSRFGKVFDLTYTRFNDLKQAEAQARESQIQLSLERVRARTMAMQNSDELPEVANLLFQQVQSLGMPAWSAGYCIWDEDKRANTLSMSSEGVLQPTLRMPLTEDPSLMHFREAHERGESFFVEEVGGEELKRHYAYLRTLPGVKETLDNIEKAGFPVPTFQIFHLAYFSKGFLLFITYEPVHEAHEIFKRFANVFEQTYTRFLDLQKAEAQARESQIQLALERVRARTMAMQHSDGLREVIQLIHQQLIQLNFKITNSGFGVDYKDTDDFNLWMADVYTEFPMKVHIPYIDHPQMNCFKEAKEKGLDFLTNTLTFEEKNKWFEYCFENLPGISEEAKSLTFSWAGLATSAALMKNVFLYLLNYDGIPYSDADNAILMRFGKVFEQTYTRFLDLQKAEAQAREAKIELGLERVRARAMAMHNSNELSELVAIMFEELVKLDLILARCIIWIFDKETLAARMWMANSEDKKNADSYYIKRLDHPYYEAIIKGWKERNSKWMYVLEGKFKKSIDELLLSETELINLPAVVKAGIRSSERTVISGSFNNFGFIEASGPTAHSEEQLEILNRFGKVFDLSYTRFSDLQKAEAQAKESQIQLALERVRARTMAMQKSDELKYAATLLFQQAKALGVPAYSCGYNIWEKGEKEFTSWMSTQDGTDINGVPNIPLTEDANFIRYVESKQNGEPFFVLELRGERMQEHYEYLKTIPAFKGYFDYAVSVGFDLPQTQIHHIANFSQGNLLFITLEPCPEFHDVFKRFAAVFEQTYTRFLDLQKAEAQVREAKIEAALEKVRSKTMAMHNSQDVGDTVATLFDEFAKLSIETFRCGIGIIHQEKKMEVWTAKRDANGKVNFFTGFMDMTMHPLLQGGFSAWKKKQGSYIYELKGDDLEEYFSRSNNNPNYPLKYDISSLPSRLIFSVFYFPEGFLFAFTLEELPAETTKIFKRFSGVFGQTYRRYLDLQKAEAQAREAQIEAALERVRSRSMGMQKSEELKEVIQVVYEQFIHLNINVEHTGFIMDYKERDDMHIWLADKHAVPFQVTIPYFDCAHWNSFNEAKEKGTDFFANHLSFEEKNKFYHDLFKLIPGVPEETLEYYFSCPGLAISTVLLDNVGLYIENFSGIPYRDEENNTLMRFGKVFQQTYTRFLDLQKAEAQVREAKIEAALERTRTQSMIMQHSKELDDTLRVFHEQVLLLGINSAFSFLWLPDEKNDRHIFWAVWGEGENGSTVFKSKAINYPLDRNEPATAQCLVDWKGNEPVVSYHVPPSGVENYFAAWQELIDGVEQLKPEYFSGGLYYVEAFMKYGCFGVMVSTDLQEDEKKVLGRFAVEFERTYTRFLDLQKAEAQAREAQIEAALERVRSRSMGMQKSEELKEVIQVIYEQFVHLNIQINTVGFILDYKERDHLNFWIANKMGAPTKQLYPYFDSPHWNLFIEAKQKGLDFFADTLTFEDKNKFFQQIFGYTPGFPEEAKDFFYSSPGWASSNVLLKNVCLFIDNLNGIPFADADNAILMRFGKVFEQTYTRFLDLQKAEAQAREAKIETSLERVRSRTMAMQHSSELADAAMLLFRQMQPLDIPAWSTGYCTWEDNKQAANFWMSSEGLLPSPFKIPLTEEPVFIRYREAYLQGEAFYAAEYSGEKLASMYAYMMEFPAVRNMWNRFSDEGTAPIFPTFQINYVVYFGQGFLLFVTHQHVPEAHDIFIRFGKVFEQTYTRFLDLQKAEAQAREAIKQASLDRVRGQIASMRSTEDLQRITPLIWHELTSLDVPFIRCGVLIIDEAKAEAHIYLSSPDGQSLAAMNLPLQSNTLTANSVAYWRKGMVYTEHWDKEDFVHWMQSMIEQGQVQNPETYQGAAKPPESLHLHFVPFTQGMLYVGNTALLTNEEIDLVKSLAETFSIAYARYEDFTKLEKAKQSIEVTLTELKATQTQLIQSEKMASLGELTAGIAHEIQNPLNFVNNFSEVSKELLDEMKEELDKGNTADAKEIAEDVIQNLEKINHHGKRADAIVKGMLQHSRSSTGVKEPTDINALADEYLRLAFHGLRAKDKSFNANMKTDYDATLEKVNVIPQDIGRVILNLITNAFYAVHEKMKQQTNGYEPTISVSTKKLDDKIFISVKDNGGGIAQKVVDKIFQPFFTTKPTGQGTGLGLSLSYDIVKAHGGEIKVETKEGEGSTFIVQLLTT